MVTKVGDPISETSVGSVDKRNNVGKMLIGRVRKGEMSDHDN